MFIVNISYLCPLSKIDIHLMDHVNYLKEQYQKGLFIASGRKIPRDGGVIIAQTDHRQHLEQILALDPFAIHKLAQYEIIEFSPSMVGIGFENLRES